MAFASDNGMSGMASMAFSVTPPLAEEEAEIISVALSADRGVAGSNESSIWFATNSWAELAGRNGDSAIERDSETAAKSTGEVSDASGES